MKKQKRKPLTKSNKIEWQGNKINNNGNKSKIPNATVPFVDTDCQLKVPSTIKKANSKEIQEPDR